MAMDVSTLQSNLRGLGLFATEADAITGWAAAFADYFEGDGVTVGAQSNGVYVAAAAIPAARSAMESALVGMSAASMAGARIAGGISAFWSALVPSTAWPTTTGITPPGGLATLQSQLESDFATNVTGGASTSAAMDRIGETIHLANQGGSAQWPAPVGPQAIL